jgi:hypothetical protein
LSCGEIVQMPLETVQFIEPARLEEANEAITDVIADLATALATLGRAMATCRSFGRQVLDYLQAACR